VLKAWCSGMDRPSIPYYLKARFLDATSTHSGDLRAMCATIDRLVGWLLFPRLSSFSKLLARLLHVHARETEEIFTQDLALRLFGELRVAVALNKVLRELEVPEGV
jgi:hypothetical protein